MELTQSGNFFPSTDAALERVVRVRRVRAARPDIFFCMKNETGLSRIKGDQAEGEEKNGGEEDGYVADFAHEGFSLFIVHAGDDDHGSVVCQQEIGGSR